MTEHSRLSTATPDNNPPFRFSQQPLPDQSLTGILNTLPNIEDRFDLIIAILEETHKNFMKSKQRQAASEAVEGILER